MGKIEFNKPRKKKKDEDSELNEDLYEMILSQTNGESDDIESEFDTEDEDDFDNCKEIKAIDLGYKLSNRLRDELKKTENKRDYLVFKYRDETLKGVPMAEINPGKFVFNINGKLRGINLAEAIIL